MTESWRHSIQDWLIAPKAIAPLITFRILFGALMLFGALRFVYNGWVERLYVEPQFFFKFYGFEWVQPLDATGMYIVFTLVALSAAGIMLGFLYRLSALVFFISFTYVELIDASNYLNHYYLVCIFAFLLIFLPAHRAFSVDSWLWPRLKISQIPAWTINILIFQLTLVYTCAGIAKLNPDWLFQAMPLAVWLPEHTDLPLLGYFFQFKWAAYVFSWAGALYDLTIAAWLMMAFSRKWAYLMVVVFHGLTWLLFNIGLFPFIMIFSTLIFFPAAVHEKGLAYLGYQREGKRSYSFSIITRKALTPVLCVFIGLQLFLPFRHFLYPGELLWTEEGYRFSWRVMLVEKIGQVTFHIKDPASQRKTEIINGQYLTRFQEKQMSIQPDFILQFAHFLKKEYQQKHGIKDPLIMVDAHVALNGRLSKRFIDPQRNLANADDGLNKKEWILPFDDEKRKHFLSENK